MASYVYTFILIVSFLFLVRKKNDNESNFSLKIIGYLILGSFAFHFNDISLPLGFVVYLLLFHPKVNVQIKRNAAVLGFLAFIVVHWALPFAIDEWNSRPIRIEHEIGLVYNVNFEEEFELVKKDLKLENNSLRLENFEVEYTENGRIRDLGWQLIRRDDNIFYIYQIRYGDKGRYSITKSKLDNWLQYDRLIDPDLFFEHLNLLDIKRITINKGEYPLYVIRGSGERVTYGDSRDSLFMIENGEIKELEKEQLPVEGYTITTYAMKKTGEQRDKQGTITQESFEGTEISDYLFNVYFVEE